MQDMTTTNQKINKTYSVQPYVHEKYGLEDVELIFKKELELPFYSSLFARYKYKNNADNGTYESYWKVDKDKKWEDTLAYKLIEDSKNGLIKVGKQGVIVYDSDTNEQYYATNYYLIYYDKNSYFNKPSINSPISDATNVTSSVTVEFLFSFEDGYILPVYKNIKTGGWGALSFYDIVQDCIDDLDCLEEFFEDCPNVTFDKEEDLITIYVCSEESCDTELTFSDDNIGRYEIKRSLSSIRIVDLQEKLDNGLKE